VDSSVRSRQGGFMMGIVNRVHEEERMDPQSTQEAQQQHRHAGARRPVAGRLQRGAAG
jgi:hypothetical protein